MHHRAAPSNTKRPLSREDLLAMATSISFSNFPGIDQRNRKTPWNAAMAIRHRNEQLGHSVITHDIRMTSRSIMTSLAAAGSAGHPARGSTPLTGSSEYRVLFDRSITKDFLIKILSGPNRKEAYDSVECDSCGDQTK